MADDNEQRRLDPEATAAPNRDKRGELPIIEGEVAAGGESPAVSEPEPPKAEERAAPEAPAPKAEERAASESSTPPTELVSRRGGARPIAAAAIGGLVGAVVAAGVLWLVNANPNPDSKLQDRVAALEAPIADLTRRVAALETTAQSANATADTVKALQGDVQAARADAAKAVTLANKAGASADQKTSSGPSAADLNAINERLKKLESAPPAQVAVAPDLAPIQARLAKIEAALAAPKNETRAAPENAPPSREDWTSLAVAAQAVSARLASGAPYPTEEAALERLGADPAKTAALKPFAEKGAPTAGALAASFAKVAPDALKEAAPKESGGVMDRLMNNMSKVVKITPVGEVPGDDPPALVSQIAAALERGDVAGAAALWARLPEPARKASQDWAAAAQARLAADAAAQGILNDAMTKLARADKT
jgi:hypothetical protein